MAVKCHICFQKTKEEYACHVCNANLKDESEKILLSYVGSFSLAETGKGTDGTLVLTNKRLVGLVDRTNVLSWIVLFLFGWLASAIADIFTKKKLSFSIPLEELDVSNFEECKLGLITKGFTVQKTTGGVVRLDVQPPAEWQSVLVEAKSRL